MDPVALTAHRPIVAIHQPNFLPWCGYFSKILHSDIFIYLDDAQMPIGRSYISRTKCIISGAEKWLTVPTNKSAGHLISDVMISDQKWKRKHLGALQNNYTKARYFDEVFEFVKPILDKEHSHLVNLNIALISAILEYLGIEKEIHLSSDLDVQSSSDDRLIELVEKVGGGAYLSGKGGQNYQHPEKFIDHNIELIVKEYAAVPYDRGGGISCRGCQSLMLFSFADAKAISSCDTIDMPRTV